jgi:hypothetical protein
LRLKKNILRCFNLPITFSIKNFSIPSSRQLRPCSCFWVVWSRTAPIFKPRPAWLIPHQPLSAMRLSQFLLAAAANLASADGSLGQVPEGRGGNLQPRETKASTHDVAKGWTPRPTERPDALDRANALELVRRGEGWIRAKRQTSNTWLNEQTCGYTAGVSCESRTNSSFLGPC